MTEIAPWTGEEQLVICLDVGTTSSGVSFVHTVKGQVPKPRVVSRWPSSPADAKIPSVILFDKKGIPQAFGAEAMEEEQMAKVDSGKWALCKWFKLMLHPPAMGPPTGTSGNSDGSSAFEVVPLPPHVNVKQAYSYLFKSATDFMKENTVDGQTIFKRMEKKIILYLAHPNGWSFAEQEVLRSAVKDSKVLGNAQLGERIQFLTESEASVHFGVFHAASNHADWLSANTTFLVVDAGGSTVDTCCYKVRSLTPKLTLEEAKTSACIQAGSVFVTRNFEAFIKQKLRKSKYKDEEYLKVIIDGFDSKTKIAFNRAEDEYIIRFAFDKDHDKAHSIFKGRITLSGYEIEACFEDCVKRIVASVKSQIGNLNISKILVVGGFGESPYLTRRLREEFETPTRKIVCVDEPSRKAVAEGLSLYHIQQSVIARSTRFEYGIPVTVSYDSCGGKAGLRDSYISASGEQQFHGGYKSIVKRNEVIDADMICRSFFYIQLPVNSSGRYSHSVELFTYSGEDGEKDHGGWWTDVTGDKIQGYDTCCTIKANLTELAKKTPTKYNSESGEGYKDLEFEVGVYIAATSLKACLIWSLDGKEIKGPASIVSKKLI